MRALVEDRAGGRRRSGIPGRDAARRRGAPGMGGGAGGMTSPARLGAIVALATLALDQASKLYFLFVDVLSLREPLVLAPFLDLIVVWNRGISYGLFQQHT